MKLNIVTKASELLLDPHPRYLLEDLLGNNTTNSTRNTSIISKADTQANRKWS